jgi:hypothetical protein
MKGISDFFGGAPPKDLDDTSKRIDNEDNLQRLVEEAKNDPSVFSNIEIEELMKIVEEEKEHHLEHLTFKKINRQIKNICLKKYNNREAYEKLRGEYKYVGELHEFRLGRYVRWMNEAGWLTVGGKIVRVGVGNEHIICSCLSQIKKGVIFNFFFNKCDVFQKLTTSEKIILTVKDYLAEPGADAGEEN